MDDKEYGVTLTVNTEPFKKKITDAEQALLDLQEVLKHKEWDMGSRSILALPEEKRIEYLKSSVTAISKYINTIQNPKTIPDLFLARENKLSIQELMDLQNQAWEKRREQEQLEKEERKAKHKEELNAIQEEINAENQKRIEQIKAETEVYNQKRKIAEESIAQSLQEIENAQEFIDTLNQLAEEEDNVQGSTIDVIAVFQNFGESLKKGIASIKRFSLSILGVQSIYSVLTKATNAYMSQDEALHNRLQANWIALGALLEPIITRLIDLFTKLVGYVNLFVKTITGGKVDLVAKAMDAVNKKSNKAKSAVAGLNKELASFDEITNINMDKGTGAGDFDVPGVGDYLNDLNNMQLNPNIVKVIEELAGALKKVWEWITSLTWVWDTLKQKIELWKQQLEGVWKIIHGLFTGNADEAKEGIDILFKAIKEEIELNQDVWTTITDKLVTAMRTALQIIFDLIKQWIKEKIKDLFEGKFNEIGIKIGKILGNQIIAFINSALWLIESAINGFFSSINLAIKKINELPGVEIQEIRKFVIPKIPALAKGNVAYEPTVAEFGEYSGANSNPEITAPQNIMRETFFEALTEALPLIGSTNNQDNREIVLNVNGREFARATYGDYQTEAKRVGSSNVAIRRG